jgi:retron-type reverse transcriptase
MVLVMLDLSSAFDTIDHDILLNRLNARYRIGGSVLEWLRSYVTDRQQAVTINGVSSVASEVKFGVPQGSVLGPLLFSLYMAPLADIISKYNLQHMFYADDTQIYFTIDERPRASLYH